MKRKINDLRNLAEELFGLFFPNLCQGCGRTLIRGEETICNICHFHLPKTYFHNDPDNAVQKGFWGRIYLEAAAAYVFFQKGGTVQHLLHQLKYKGRQEIGIRIGKWYGQELKEADGFRDTEVIIPVPLHPHKLKKRGYNQSELFAEGLSAAMKIRIETGCLYRRADSKTQTRKSRYDRWENVGDIFAVRHPERLTGKRILLVDDVITTGATLEACAAALKQIPGIRISVAAIAFASG